MKQDELVNLITEWTVCEIKARFPTYIYPNVNQHTITECFWTKKVEIEDKIRKAVFGSDCLVEIADQLGLMEKPDPKADKKKRRRSKKKRLKTGRRANR